MNPIASVLVVDDEKLIRWSLQERLSRAGYDVTMAETGEEALAKLDAGPDIVLLDVRLPGISGIEVLQQAFARHPDTAVVMMSAHSTIDVAVEAMKLGALDFLVKPFAFEALEVVVERALATARTRKQIASLARDQRSGRALDAIVGDSAPMREVRHLSACVAANAASTCLIEGESGVGKEVVARAIHAEGERAGEPFLQVNCATLPEHLLESELFGHERGAFTDAHAAKRGLFETAAGGTVLLDEIGDLPPAGQAKLLLLLENRTFRRVGGLAELKSRARVLAATNARLESAVEVGRFRADLYYRLNVVRISVPPLREHADDIPLLAAHFIAKLNHDMKRQVSGIAPSAMERLCAYHWPGNIRQLRNTVERALILYPRIDELRVEHLPAEIQEVRSPLAAEGPRGNATDGLPLEEAEKRIIMRALDRAAGNQSKAARALGITRDTLRYRMRKHGLL